MVRNWKSRISKLLLVSLTLSLTTFIPPRTYAKSAQSAQQASHAIERQGQKDRPVEVVERRTPSSKTLRNPDGTLTTQVFNKALHYRDASGNLQLIQNTLVAETGGRVFRNAANRYQVHLKADLGPDFLTFSYRGRSMSMDLEGARPQRANLRSNQLTYAEALPNTDLSYTVANDLVKEEIILRSPEAGGAINFSLRLNGARAETDTAGAIRFRDQQTDETLWTIPQMYMRDAAGALSPVPVGSEQTGEVLRLTLRPDEGWLKDPARLYPVVIDPTIALQPDFSGGMDTSIANEEGLQDLNLGFDAALSVGSNYASLLKFDLSAIPRASTIESATLGLQSLSFPPKLNTTGAGAPTAAPTLSVSTYTSSLPAGTYTVVYTYTNPQGETLPSPAATIDVEESEAIDVNTGPLPAGVSGVKLYLGLGGPERLALTSDRPEATLTSLPDSSAPLMPMLPTTPPAVSIPATSGSIAAGTYSVLYTYVTAQGETDTSPAASVTVPSSYKALTINVGAFPAGVTSAKVYLGQPNLERLATTITNSASPSATVTSLPSSTAALPPSLSAQYVGAPEAPPAVSQAAAPAGAPGFPAGTYQVRYSYLNSLGETPASQAAAVTVADGQAVQVTVGRLPNGIASANIYIGLTSETAVKAGNIPASTAASAVTFGLPPALTSVPAPVQAPAILSDPQTAPEVTATVASTPFVAGEYDLAYTFFAPNGETAPSPITTVTLKAGDLVKVTAGESLPDGATGLHVYMAMKGEPLSLVASRTAAMADSAKPWIELKAPQGYRPVPAPTANIAYVANDTSATSGISAPVYAPTLRALSLTEPANLEPATYYVKYSWIYPRAETAASPYASVSVADGQAVEVAGTTLPTGALGMRVYMGRVSTNLWLVATSMGNRTVVSGAGSMPAAPVTNGTKLPPPTASVINLTTLPAGTYYVAYTFTNASEESAPSQIGTLTVNQGQSLNVKVPAIPAQYRSANIYLEMDPSQAAGFTPKAMRLVAATTGETARVTALPTSSAPAMIGQPGASAAPELAAANPTSLGSGTYSVRYTYTDGRTETAPSDPAMVAARAGQELVAIVPPAPAGLAAANLYVGSAGAERLVQPDATPGVPLHVTTISSDGRAVPGPGAALLPAPSVAAGAGGTLTGDLYFSYRFYGSSQRTLRSPETLRTFASPNGTASVTTGVAPSWATGVQIIAGAAPGEGKLVADVPVAAGSRATASVTRAIPNGLAIYPVTTPWNELDATWVRASANLPWFDRGGDYARETAVAALGGGPAVNADLTGLVRAWANGAMPNHGILLKGVGSTVQFGSSDNAEESLRPVLTITYREKTGAPRVSLTGAARVPSGIQLSASVAAQDSATTISRADFYVNDALVGSDAEAPYTVTWDSANLPGGTYRITVRAYDQWGQEGSSAWELLLSDSFEETSELDLSASTVSPDTSRGLITLPVSRSPVAINSVAASSEKAGEIFLAENLLDGNVNTYWRSPGQPIAAATETVRFDLTAKTTAVTLTVRPNNPKDGLTVKAQAIDGSGSLLNESVPVVLDADTKTVSVSSTVSFGTVRLLFSNLRRDLASGLYHAEVKEVSGTTLKLAAVKSYEATYEARNATDGQDTTHWVSAGQSSPTGQEYLELSLAGAANAIYIKPRTPGMTASFAVFKGVYEGWEQIGTVSSLEEGVYPLSMDTDRLRIYFTGLQGMSGPGAPAAFYAGADEVAAYQLALSADRAEVRSRLVTLPEANNRFLLEADDSQPPGSQIRYTLSDGVQDYEIIPGIPLTLPVSTGAIQLKAALSSASRMAVPSLVSWRLYASHSDEIKLDTGVDTIAPEAGLILPVNKVFSGPVTLPVAVSDNVGVTRVELYADNSEAAIAMDPADGSDKAPNTPFELTLNTADLSPGKHMLWIKAYDAAGNVAVSPKPTSTYQAFTDSLVNVDAIDENSSANFALVSGAIQAATGQLETLLTGSGSASKAISTGPGIAHAQMEKLKDSSGCVAGTLSLQVTDQAARGDCRPLDVKVYTTSTAASYTLSASQEGTGTWTASVQYPGALSASAPYQDAKVVSRRVLTSGPVAGVTIQATVNKPAGTDVVFFVSADDGKHYEQATPGVYTPVHYGGSRLRLRADLKVAAGAGYAYSNLTPQLLDWSAQVTEYISPQTITVSQVQPPGSPSVSMSGNQATLKWTPSSYLDSNLTYSVYRSTQPGPEGPRDLVASGLKGTTLVDGAANNLLKNAGYESGLTGWSKYTHWHTSCDSAGVCSDYSYTYWTFDTSTVWSGSQSFKMSHSATDVYGTYQSVTVNAPAGTTFTLGAQMKGSGLTDSSSGGFGLTVYYNDGTSVTQYGSTPSGTFDWTPVRASITATKPVTSVKAMARIYGAYTAWYDAIQLDTRGATEWYATEPLDPTKTYYYRVVAVSSSGEPSAPSDEVNTAPAPTAPTVSGLGVKGFWPYSPVQLPGGPGYVNMASGNLAYGTTDLVYPGRLLATAFRRTYNAMGSNTNGPLGPGWDHNFNWTLKPSEGGAMLLKEGDGSTFSFRPGETQGSYVTPPGSRMRLVKSGDDYSLLRYDNNLLYRFTGEKLQQIVEPNGNSLTMHYDPTTGLLDYVAGSADSTKVLSFEYTNGRITRVHHPGFTDPAVEFEYDESGHLVRATDLEHQSTNYSYDDLHRMVQVTDPVGQSTVINYADGSGAVGSVTYPDGATVSFTYGAAGDTPGWTRSTVTDPAGFAVTYQVDAAGLLKKQTFPYGSDSPATALTGSVAYEHDTDWNVTKYTDPRGQVYQIAYDGYGNPTAVTDPSGNVSRSLFTLKPHPMVPQQSLNVLAQSTDALGNTTVYTTDARGNVVLVEDPLLQRTELTYRDSGLRDSVKDPNGNVTRYDYYDNGWVRTVTNPLGATVVYAYDQAGNPSSITDPLGHKTTMEYDLLGRRTQVTGADGTAQHYRYDGEGNLFETIDPSGAKTWFEYNSRNLLVRSHQWPNPGDYGTEYVTAYEYDLRGSLVAVTDPRGKRSTFTFDGSGRKLSEANPLGQKTSFVYDAAGNMTKWTDPLGSAATAEYDSLNRRTKTTVPQDSTYKLETTVAYDALGRMTSQKDALGNTTTYYYDAVGRLLMVVDPMGFGTTYAYDRAGNRLSVSDAQRRTTQWVYNAANQVTEEHRPDGTSGSSQYDLAGRLTASVNGRNQTIGYRYDEMNRLVEQSFPSGQSVRYAYDSAGRRTSMTDWNGTTRYQYNQLGWLLRTEDPWGHAVSYSYDESGNRTEMNLQYTGTDATWTYGYDDAGRLTQLQSPGVALANTFTYDAGSRLTKLNFGNGDVVNQGYNKAGELLSVSSSSKLVTSVSSFTYGIDQGGRRTSISRSGSGVVGGAVYYKYDADSRVTAAGPSSAASDREYYFDLVGNRHTMVVNTGDPKGVYTYVPDAANRLIEEFGPLPAAQGGGRYHQSYTYDGEGSQTRMERDGKEVSLYSYDEESRLLQVTNSLGQVTKYTYNGDGQRVRMEEPAGTTIFIYDGSEVLAEADATGAIQVLYTRMGSGRLISQWQKGETYWYHLDGLGSTIALTDESGKIRNRYGYDEYGNFDPGSTQEVMNRYTFTGQAWDSSSGLYNYKARYYNPGVGRFLTHDTYKGNPWEPWTQNLYVYVGNNPVNYTDPTGHMADNGSGGCLCGGAYVSFGLGASVAAGIGMVPDPLAGTSFGWGVPRGDTVLEIRDLTQGRIKNGVPVGQWTLRVDQPHPGASYAHINTQGVAEAAIANHTPIPSSVLNVARNADTLATGAGRALTVVAAASDGVTLYDAYNADGGTVGKNTVTEGAGVAGSWAGAWAGAEGGAALGATAGTAIAPGPGTVVGGLLGGVVGGIGGSLGGRALGRWIGRGFFE